VRILILQLTRMGDMIQTTPLVRGLKKKYPNAHITAMLRPMSVPIAERVPEIDDVIVYEEDDIFHDLQSGDSDRLLRAYITTETYINDLRKRQFDVAYNCTHSTISGMLLRIVEMPRVFGADFNDEWRFVLRGPWTNYFFTSAMTREYNALNLCDVFQRIEPDPAPRQDLALEVTAADRAAAQAILDKADVGPDDKIICFQIGASDDNKRWAEANYAALAKRIVEKYNARIFLVGVKDEGRYGERFETLAPGLATHLFGKTSIGELAGLLERSDLLVTNDTGTMHVAATVKCPITLVSVGYVQFRETGPYLPDCVAIEKRRVELKRSGWSSAATPIEEQPSPHHVFQAVEATLAARAGRSAPSIPDTPDWKHIYMYRSEFAPDGCLEWYPLVKRPPSRIALVRLAYRAMWLDYLDEDREYDNQEQFRKMLAHHQVDPDAAQNDLRKLITDFAGIRDQARHGVAATEQLLQSLTETRDLATAQKLAADLTQLDEAIRVYGELHRDVKPLVTIARFGRDNLEGLDPVVLAQSTLAIYQAMEAEAAGMEQKLLLLTEVVAPPVRSPAHG